MILFCRPVYKSLWRTLLEVVKAGSGGRMGTWAYSLAFCNSAGLVEFGRLVASGQAEIRDKDTLLECYGKFYYPKTAPWMKVASGAFQISSAPYEISSVLNGVLTIIGVRAKGKSLDLIAEIDPDIPGKGHCREETAGEPAAYWNSRGR
jgi:hypothetical protein